MGVAEDLQADVAAIKQSLINIRADIAKLSSTIPATGGLTEAQAQALKSDLDAIASDAKSIDDLTPNDAPTPEPTV